VLQLVLELLGPLALGDVPQDARRKAAVLRLPDADGQLDRKLAAVPAPSDQLEDAAGE
jgi:hypothetical protein